MILHQGQRLRQRRARIDGERIDHHAGLELLDLTDLRGLLLRLEIAVNDAKPPGLRHGDRHLGLGHSVHGRGDDRNIERNVAGDSRADVGVGRQQFGQSRLEQDVVEGERFAQRSVAFLLHRQLQWPLANSRPHHQEMVSPAPNGLARLGRFWIGAGR